MKPPEHTAPNVRAARYGWIFGAKEDLLFLFFPVFLAILFFAASQTSPFMHSAVLTAVVAQAAGLSPFHLGSTWFHYFDKTNRAHYLSTPRNRNVFYIAPFLVFVGSVLLALFCFPLAALVFIGWSLQHLVKQNTGILLLYHNSRAGEAIVERKIELNSQYASNIAFALMFFTRIFIQPTGVPVLINFARGLIAIAVLVSVFYCVSYFNNLRNQLKEGALLNVPAFCFWIVSVLWLSPLAFLGHDYYDAVLIPNTMHFLQYIGLNYQLVKTKYKDSENLAALPMKQPVVFYLLVSLTLVVIYNSFSAFTFFFAAHSLAQNALIGAVQGLGNMHYFQDAFIWRFREEFNRKSFLAYLKTASF